MDDLARLGYRVDTTGLERAQREIRALREEAMRTTQQLTDVGGNGRTSSSLKNIGTEAANTGKAFERSSTSVSSFATGLGKVLGAVSVTALGRSLVGIASDFDGSMSVVQSKLLVADEAMVDLRETAKDLGTTTRFSASEAADAMGFLAQAGLDSEEILGAIGPSLDLAAAGGLSLAQSADIATNVMGGFRLSVDDLPDVMDKLAISSARSNTLSLIHI